ncbi:hypothetical protein HPB50_004722 [Hyalomma asiaticum]|uniref:Uncharacterized protein n=1 Tax=Hyalomma asiaticum TaxID=266040 RepID=A0ACB7SXL1_HYAAI|nr:hypothetical protein HPB50_004722 [Hyalomma asiaticum]
MKLPANTTPSPRIRLLYCSGIAPGSAYNSQWAVVYEVLRAVLSSTGRQTGPGPSANVHYILTKLKKHRLHPKGMAALMAAGKASGIIPRRSFAGAALIYSKIRRARFRYMYMYARDETSVAAFSTLQCPSQCADGQVARYRKLGPAERRQKESSFRTPEAKT